jgi:hypothetical protein
LNEFAQMHEIYVPHWLLKVEYPSSMVRSSCYLASNKGMHIPNALDLMTEETDVATKKYEWFIHNLYDIVLLIHEPMLDRVL